MAIQDQLTSDRGRASRRRAARAKPDLDEDEDWSTERDDPTFGDRPTESNSRGTPIPPSRGPARRRPPTRRRTDAHPERPA